MTYYDDYLDRINIYGNTEQEKLLTQGKQIFSQFIKYAPNKFSININDDIINLYDVVIQDNSTSESVLDRKLLMCDYNSIIQTGVYFNWKNDNWLITIEDEKVIDSYKKFFIKKASNYLSFINDVGNIYSFPCIYQISSKSSSDTSENNHMELLDGDAIIRVQNNEYTIKIKKGDRFIFSKNESYSVKNIYTELEEGIIILKVKQYEMNNALDKEIDFEGRKIWIANYENRPQFTIKFNTSDSEFSIGDNIELDYTLLDGEGIKSDKTVIFSSSDSNIVSVSNNIATAVNIGNAIIKVQMSENENVFDEITLSVVNIPIENISYEINPDVSLLLRGQSKVFEVLKKNNGIVESETYTFSIDSSSTINEKYEFTVIDSKSFRILNEGIIGNLVIKIIPNSNPTDVFTHSFEFKNSFW